MSRILFTAFTTRILKTTGDPGNPSAAAAAEIENKSRTYNWQMWTSAGHYLRKEIQNALKHHDKI